MNIASKFESYTVCILPECISDFSRKNTFKSKFRESVGFEENALIS